MAIIAVHRGPRGPLANYVQAVRKGMAGRGMGQDGSDVSGYTVDPNTGEYVPETTFNVSSIAVPSNIADLTPSLGSTPPTGSPATASNPSGSGFNLGNFFQSLAGDAASAAKLYQSLQTPGLIPGTNAIYNPATGQYYNPTTGQVVNPGGASTLGVPTDLSAYMPQILLYGGLALGAMLLIGAMGKH